MKDTIRTILDDIMLDTDRIESLNGIFSEIADDIVGKDNYLATRLYSVSYCSDLLVKSINEKIDKLYKLASDIKESEKVEDEH